MRSTSCHRGVSGRLADVLQAKPAGAASRGLGPVSCSVFDRCWEFSCGRSCETCGLGNNRGRPTSCPCEACGRFADVLQAFTRSRSRSPCGHPKLFQQRTRASLLRSEPRVLPHVQPLLVEFPQPQLRTLWPDLRLWQQSKAIPQRRSPISSGVGRRSAAVPQRGEPTRSPISSGVGRRSAAVPQRGGPRRVYRRMPDLCW